MAHSLQLDELDVTSVEKEDNHPMSEAIATMPRVVDTNRSTDVINPKYTFTKDPVEPSAFNNFHFQEPHGSTSNFDIDKPSDIFQHFLSDDIMQKIVAESNKYAKQNGTGLELDIEEL
ncbi:hypothetical protein JTB14_023577 [Gonioctena quinquepunctata]|nr:hypothetical protein JTB14_023577 [Gonioctena quinquepunctata]